MVEGLIYYNLNIIWTTPFRSIDGSSLSLCYCRFDIGDIVTQEKIDIHADETLPMLDMKLAKLGANALIDVIGKLPQVLSSSKPQGKLGITYGNFFAAVLNNKIHRCFNYLNY